MENFTDRELECVLSHLRALEQNADVLQTEELLKEAHAVHQQACA